MLAYILFYGLMPRPEMKIKVGHSSTISECRGGLWECEARNNPSGIVFFAFPP